MEHNKQMPAVALGTWSWGTGAVGGDQVFGNHLSAEDLKPVFDTAMEQGLNLWDTAVVYDGPLLERAAQLAGTIPYELLCAVSPRVPRVYLERR